MKREEKIKQTREKILTSAIQEFNVYDYDTASMNRICSQGDISKGIIYHYFKDKDELYLACVRTCFDTLVMNYKEYDHQQESVMEDVTYYMDLRVKFFVEHPELRGIFFHTLLKTPKHLEEYIKKIKQEYDEINRLFYRDLLNHLVLRKDVTMEVALTYFEIMLQMFNDYFRKEVESGQTFENVIEKHEQMIFKLIDFMIFGIATEGDKQ